jgi:hypothetical protein
MDVCMSATLIDDSLSCLESLPVHATKYSNILKWHLKPGIETNILHYKYQGKIFVPLYTIGDSFCVAYWKEHPAVIIKFILGRLTSVDHSSVAGLIDFMMARALKSKLFVRVVHSTKLSSLQKIPANGFIKNTCYFTIRCWSSLAIFPVATPNMLPIIRLASYLGLSHPPYETFNSEREYEQFIFKKNFERLTSDLCEVEATSWVSLLLLVRCISKLDPKSEVARPFPIHPADQKKSNEFQHLRFPNYSSASLPSDEFQLTSDEIPESRGLELLGVDSSRRSKSPTGVSRLKPIAEDEEEAE